MSVFQVGGRQGVLPGSCDAVWLDADSCLWWLLRFAHPQDIFDVLEIDPTGKKFDKGARARAFASALQPHSCCSSCGRACARVARVGGVGVRANELENEGGERAKGASNRLH